VNHAGSIHGRFQPFHNGHLAYALAALEHVDTLYIGLTRVLSEPGIGQTTAPHRLDPRSNPLSYFERVEVVSAALTAAGVRKDHFSVGPFPIEVPGRLPEFWPTNLTCFTTIVDEWNREKVKALRDVGYNVVVLEGVVSDPTSVRTGTQIRAMIRDRSDEWKLYVPSATVPLVERYRASFEI
jgi:cytidyltransferase-like protein